MHIPTKNDGIWLSEGNLLVRFDPESLEDQEMAFTDQEKITGFAVSDNYVMTKPTVVRFCSLTGGKTRCLRRRSRGTSRFL